MHILSTTVCVATHREEKTPTPYSPEWAHTYPQGYRHCSLRAVIIFLLLCVMSHINLTVAPVR